MLLRGNLSTFPCLNSELDELNQKQQELVTTLEMIRIEEFIISSSGDPRTPCLR